MFGEQEEAGQVGKLSREVVERLLWRPEDTPDRLEHSIQQYSTNVLPLVEVKLCMFVPSPQIGGGSMLSDCFLCYGVAKTFYSK